MRIDRLSGVHGLHGRQMGEAAPADPQRVAEGCGPCLAEQRQPHGIVHVARQELREPLG